MTDNYWLSRRPKYNLEETFRIAWYYVLNDGFCEALPSLRLASQQDHEEATFLLKHIETSGLASPIRKVDHNYTRMSFIKNPDLRAVKYALWFTRASARQESLVLEMAQNGDAMCQYMTAQFCKRRNDRKGAIQWHRKAAEQNFSPSIYKLSRLLKTDSVESDAWLLQGANLRDPLAMETIMDPFLWRGQTKLPVDLRIRFHVQLAMYGKRSELIVFSKSHATSFIVGQEFDDYEKYYPLVNEKISILAEAMIDSYRQMTSKARRGSLHTILTLRQIGVCRDIAIMIGKFVYTTRAQREWNSNLG